MVNFLRDKNKGKIFFIKSGVFYIAVAQDAVFLSKTLLLRTTCHKKNNQWDGAFGMHISEHFSREYIFKEDYLIDTIEKEDSQKIMGDFLKAKNKKIDDVKQEESELIEN